MKVGGQGLNLMTSRQIMKSKEYSWSRSLSRLVRNDAQEQGRIHALFKLLPNRVKQRVPVYFGGGGAAPRVIAAFS